MKDYFFKKYQKAKLHFQNARQKLIVRGWGLAKRLDQSHSKNEQKKPKQK